MRILPFHVCRRLLLALLLCLGVGAVFVVVAVARSGSIIKSGGVQPKAGVSAVDGRAAATDVCSYSFPHPKQVTTKIRFGKKTIYNQDLSRIEICTGAFGAPDQVEVWSTAAKCDLIANILNAVIPTTNDAIEDEATVIGGVDCAALNPSIKAGVGGVVCGALTDLLGTGVKTFTGVGKTFSKGLVVFRTVAFFAETGICVGIGDGVAEREGVKLETKHEVAVARDVMKQQKCLQYTQKRILGIENSNWSAIKCPEGFTSHDKSPFRVPESSPPPTKLPAPPKPPSTPTPPPAPITTTPSPPTTTTTTPGPTPTPTPGPGPGPTPVPPTTTTYTQVTPLGPTSGRSGFSVGIGIPACPYPSTLNEYADGQALLDFSGSGDSYPSSGVAYAPWPSSPNSLSVGTHQLTFKCFSTTPGTTTLQTLWTDPGFSIDVTAAQTPTSVVSTTVPFRGVLTFNSGAPAGSAPCPAVQGLTATGLNPLLVDSDYVIQDYKNIVPSSTDTTEALGITASDEDEIDYAGMSCNYAPVGETWRNTSTYLYMFGYTRVTVSY